MVKCNTREYVAICVDMEVISTSKKRRKESYNRNTTQLFHDQCYANDDGLSAIFFAN